MIDFLLSGIRVFFGLVFILFIPGFSISLLVFRKSGFDALKRIAISPVLSVIVVFLVSLIYDLLLGIDTTGLNVFIGLCTVSVVSIVAWSWDSRNLHKTFGAAKNVRRAGKSRGPKRKVKK